MNPLRRLSLFSCALILAAGFVALGTGVAHAATLKFADEFNGPTLNTSVWKVATPFNTQYVRGELEWYDPANLSFVNGNLRIKTERRSVNGYSYASGMITSLNHAQFSYGYYEMRAKLPKGKGIWPAFWLTNDRTQEIDALELLGEQPTRMYMTYHKGGTQITQSYYDGQDFSQAYHTFAVDWQPTYIKWYVDGVLRKTYTGSIPADGQWIVINTAVGGAWPQPPDSTTPLPQYYDIDYVRVYDQKPADGTTPPTDTTTPPPTDTTTPPPTDTTTPPPTDTGSTPPPADANLVYADEFTSTFDSSVWAKLTPFSTHHVTGELQYYAEANTTVLNGYMHILTERRVINGYNYASGIVTSLNRPKFSYGYFEMRGKLPKGKGIWPAFWLTNNATLEIDAMELLGEQPTRMYMTYHRAGSQITQGYYDGADFSQGYHTFAVDWQPTYIKWYVDGVLRKTYTGSIPSDPMWIVINTAVGGAWPLPPDSTTPLPQTFDVDYVRVYKQKPADTTTDPGTGTTPPPPGDTTTPPPPGDTTTPPPATSLITVWRFYNTRNATHFYTASAEERDAVIANWSATFKYEGAAYTLDPAKNIWPLYRFYNPYNQSHFYTASRTERDAVIAKYSDWTYEGVAYNVSRTADAGPAVYRFYNTKNGSHFYTASTAERDTVIAKYSNTYSYEGVAFYLGQ